MYNDIQELYDHITGAGPTMLWNDAKALARNANDLHNAFWGELLTVNPRTRNETRDREQRQMRGVGPDDAVSQYEDMYRQSGPTPPYEPNYGALTRRAPVGQGAPAYQPRQAEPNLGNMLPPTERRGYERGRGAALRQRFQQENMQTQPPPQAQAPDRYVSVYHNGRMERQVAQGNAGLNTDTTTGWGAAPSGYGSPQPQQRTQATPINRLEMPARTALNVPTADQQIARWNQRPQQRQLARGEYIDPNKDAGYWARRARSQQALSGIINRGNEAHRSALMAKRGTRQVQYQPPTRQAAHAVEQNSQRLAEQNAYSPQALQQRYPQAYGRAIDGMYQNWAEANG